MEILVMGGCGFLGSRVFEFYSKKGASVIAYDNMTKHEIYFKTPGQRETRLKHYFGK